MNAGQANGETMGKWRSFALLLLLLLANVVASSAWAQGSISDLPSKETPIVWNAEGTIKNAGWFNILVHSDRVSPP